MRSDGGAVFTHIEQQLPQFIQTKHPKFAKFVEKYYGDDSGLRKERVRMLQQFEDMLENEPAGEGEEGFSLRQRAIQRLEDVINFERGLGEEQLGSRGQEKKKFVRGCQLI